VETESFSIFRTGSCYSSEESLFHTGYLCRSASFGKQAVDEDVCQPKRDGRKSNASTRRSVGPNAHGGKAHATLLHSTYNVPSCTPASCNVTRPSWLKKKGGVVCQMFGRERPQIDVGEIRFFPPFQAMDKNAFQPFLLDDWRTYGIR
jgi:hypothetical protein